MGGLSVRFRNCGERKISKIGIACTEFVAKAAPDGYTYLSVASKFASTAAVLPVVPYDPVKDFSGVSLTAGVPA